MLDTSHSSASNLERAKGFEPSTSQVVVNSLPNKVDYQIGDRIVIKNDKYRIENSEFHYDSFGDVDEVILTISVIPIGWTGYTKPNIDSNK